MRCLRQWQALNDEPISEKIGTMKVKWLFIIYMLKLYADYYIMRLPNTTYFATKEKAEEAIEVFR